MADLTEKASSETTKIVGANPSTGVEDNYVEVDSTGAMSVSAKVTDGTNTSSVLNAAPGSDTGQSALAVRVISQLGGAGGTQYADGAARGTSTGTLLMIDDGVNIQSAIGSSSGVLYIQGYQPLRTFMDITSSASSGTFSCKSYNLVTFTVSGTYAGVSFIFEGTDDGVNWFTIQAVRNDIGVIETGGTLLTNITRSWDAVIGGFVQVRIRATAWTSGDALIGVNFQTMAYDPSPAVTLSPIKPTYSASTAAFTPPSTPSDLFTIVGSTTKTIKIIKLEISATQTTAGINTFFLAKRSTANTGGTSTTLTKVPHDSSFAAASATVVNYTVNPTSTGSLVGNVRTSRVLCPAPASVIEATYTWNFEDGQTAVPIVLRGAAETLALNFGGAALPSGLSVTVSCTWTEE